MKNTNEVPKQTDEKEEQPIFEEVQVENTLKNYVQKIKDIKGGQW